MGRDACRKLNVERYAAAAWRVLDEDMGGSITMREYSPESAELLFSFKEWVEVNFGSVKNCFTAIDTDRSGSVTFGELKRACFKLNWTGDVKLLFECLDVDGRRSAEERKKTLSLDEVSFLDSWHFEPTEEELSAEDAAKEPPKPKASARDRQLVASISERLSSPMGPSRRGTPASVSGNIGSLPNTRPATTVSTSGGSLPGTRPPTRYASEGALPPLVKPRCDEL